MASFYSDLSGASDIERVFSAKEKAISFIKKQRCGRIKLQQVKHRKTGELLDFWSDGDYCLTINEVNIDGPLYD